MDDASFMLDMTDDEFNADKSIDVVVVGKDGEPLKHYADQCEEEDKENVALQELLFKLQNCPTYSSMYDLESRFNEVGLSIQITTKNRMILCKIVNGKPHCKDVVDDYIFIGSLRDRDVEISERMLDCIVNFVTNAASSEPAEIVDAPRKWQDGVRLYGRVLSVNEEINRIAQDVILG